MKKSSILIATDENLIAKCISGDTEAFSGLYYKYGSVVESYLYKKTKNKDLAFDLKQDVFINAFQYIKNGTFVEEGKFKYFIFRIAHNLYVNHVKCLRTQLTTSIVIIKDGNEFYKQLLDNNHNPEEVINIKEINKIISSSLPEKIRDTFFLRLEGYKYEEIAQKLNIPDGTVRSNISRDRKILEIVLN